MASGESSQGMEQKPKQKQKVLLMGKSGAGKSSMRNIIFTNYVAKDVRRLGATIDVETSRVKFLGRLDLNLWDCGGQDVFTENYLTTQREFVFNDVGVLIYVFEVESRELERDLFTYNQILQALDEFSPEARVFCLVHKMDLIHNEYREIVFQEKEEAIRAYSGKFAKSLIAYPTSIWDQTLYKAWGNIVQSLVPKLDVIENYLKSLAEAINAEEVILFERITFLSVMSVTNTNGQKNPYVDRLERLSNIIKHFKHSLSKFVDPESQSNQYVFGEIFVKTSRFNLILARLTNNTYIFVVLPPGEAQLNCARINVANARAQFVSFDPPKSRTGRFTTTVPQRPNPVPESNRTKDFDDGEWPDLAAQNR